MMGAPCCLSGARGGWAPALGTSTGLAGSPLPPGLGRRCQRQRRRACRPAAALSGEHVEQLLRTAESLVRPAASAEPSQLDHLAARVTNLLYTLGDAPPAAVVEAAKKDDGGIFAPLANLFESILKVLESGLSKVGTPYAYGFAIILLTLLVKAATFPLSQKSVQSTVAMQALQPRVKAIQNKYKNGDQQEMQVQVAALYRDAGVNPLAGCLPTLATLPVWIGLYRALSNVADEGLLTAGFFWIPSLAGPTSLAAQKAGAGSWLFPFKDGVPPLGWHDTLAYLVLPVLLVVSQYASQKIMSPPTDDPAQKQTQQVLQFLPILIGYFSLNVPSGLTLYWFVNNLLTTAQTVYLKNTTPPPKAAMELSGSGAASFSGSGGTIVKPEKQAAKAQRKAAAAAEGKGSGSGGGSKQGEKFRALKAKEAAKRAARLSAQAGGGDGSQAGAEQSQGGVQTESRDERPQDKAAGNGSG